VTSVHLTLIGKPGCHLCDEARDVIAGVLDGIRSQHDDLEIELGERSILEDRELYDRYVEEIPVLLIDGKVHTYWRVDPERLSRALLGKKRDTST
jgi:glutaredoxin